MILVIDHGPGTNGDAYAGTPEQLAKIWNARKKWDNGAKMRAVCHSTGLQCMAVHGGGYAVGRYFDGAHRTKFCTYLLSALKWAQKGGGAL